MVISLYLSIGAIIGVLKALQLLADQENMDALKGAANDAFGWDMSNAGAIAFVMFALPFLWLPSIAYRAYRLHSAKALAKELQERLDEQPIKEQIDMVKAEIERYEIKYDLASAVMMGKLKSGEMEETADILSWSIACRILELVKKDEVLKSYAD